MKNQRNSKQMELTRKEKEELYLCISARVGYIETGEMMLRASDAIRSGQQNKVKALSREQRDLVNLLEDLQYKMLNS